MGRRAPGWWFDARGEVSAPLREAVAASACAAVLLSADQDAAGYGPAAVVRWVRSLEQLRAVERSDAVLTDDRSVLEAALGRGQRAGLYVLVQSLEHDFPTCLEVCDSDAAFLIADLSHASYIPYELLLARTEHRGIEVLCFVPIAGLDRIVNDTDQALNALSTMEQGVGVVLRTQSAAVVGSIHAALAGRRHGELLLVPATVQAVRHTALGHRVCADTTTMLEPEEGLVVGSAGWGGILVCSETHYLPHMNLREFRVNAGGMHSYVWGPNETAMYLSELKAGSEVLAVNRDGRTRLVTVGRAKVERRPLLCIDVQVRLDDLSAATRERAEELQRRLLAVTPPGERADPSDGSTLRLNVFLQNDWHVRVMGADGFVKHATLLQPGDRVLAHVDLPGRHTGLRVTETIYEH